jgi:hypothetical protein
MGLSVPHPNQPEGQGYLPLPIDLLKTCPAWLVLSAAGLPPTWLVSSLIHPTLLAKQQYVFKKVEVSPWRKWVYYHDLVANI